MKSAIRIILFLLAVLLLTGCTQEPKIEEMQTVVISDTVQDLQQLEEYTNLQTADLRGFRNYDEIMEYIAGHPDVEVIYDVTIGTQTFTNDVTQLNFSSDDTPCDSILELVKYLPNVTRIILSETTFTPQQMEALRAAYPDVQFVCSFNIGGKVIGENATLLDLSQLSRDEIMQSLDSISLLPKLTTIELMNASGESPLDLVDVNMLQDALPGVFINYSFDLFGQTVSVSDEVVEFDEVPIGNEGEQRIRQALDVLDNCTYFKLDDCGIDNEIMAQIREDYPDTKVVWRIHIEPFSMLTDETMLRLTFHLNDDNVHDLKYLNDVTYLDVGHNEPLTDISFVQYMPKLECVIISGSSVVDVSYFQYCPNLVWLEMCFCYKIQDISCLKDHETLKYLNISFSDVADLTPLENVDLERLNSMGNWVNYEQRVAFTEKHPDCLSVWEGVQPYGYGWRYNDYGYTFFEYYANMRIVFRYDEQGYFGNHKER